MLSACWQPIEGLHDAVRTYTRSTLPLRLVSFCMARYREKQNKKRVNFWFTSQTDLKFPPSVCANILVTQLWFGIVVWSE